MRTGAAALTIAIAALALAGCVSEEPAPQSPASSTSATPSASASPTSDAAGIVAVPSSCTELVPAAQQEALDHLELNTAQAQSAGLPSGLDEPLLADLAAERRVLACVWEGPTSEATSLRTTISRITGGDGGAIVKLLTDAQVQCYQADAGIRCEYSSVRDSPAIEYGETHFIRDDVWIATSW